MTGTSTRMTRRSVVTSFGIGALGLAGAALLGCGQKTETAATSPAASGSKAATGTQVLPLTAPVVQGTPKKGGTFSENIGAVTWVQHDSHTQLGASEWHVISEKTIESDPVTAKLLPSVATSWETPDPSGLTLVLKIKPGIKMHNVAPWNGREFTAADVAWNLERIGGLYAEKLKLPASSFQRATMVRNIAKAEATDNYTVKVTLSAPNSGLFNGISENRTMLMPKEMDDIGYSDPMKFGGIGPFQMAEFTKDTRVRMKRFDGYTGFRANEPYFDEFALQTIPDVSSAIAAFASGQIQLLSVSNPQDVQTIQKAKSDALLYQWIDCNWSHLRPSWAYEPFKDARVRKAIFESIDYVDIGNGSWGSGWGFQGPLSVGFAEAWKPDKVKATAGFNPDTKAADRADASKLFAAAGYPNGKGLDFEVMYQENAAVAYLRENSTRFQSQMQQVFPEIKVRLKPVDPGTYATQQASGNFHMVSYVITATPDPVLELISQHRTEGSRNYGRYSNPETDALLDKALKELNSDARSQLLDQFQQKFVTDWTPLFVLHANAARQVLQSNITGWDKFAGTWHGYSDWTKIGRIGYIAK